MALEETRNTDDVQMMDIDCEENLTVPIKKYKERPGKIGLHGDIYQTKLLMLFLKRSLDNKYRFRLCTEKAAAKKFDDLVLEVSTSKGIEYRLLQAKHKDDECQGKVSPKIKFDGLLTEKDGDFSLTKYYFSYHDSKKEEMFQAGVIKDVTLCTNINFDEQDQHVIKSTGEVIHLRDVLKKIDEVDDILNVECKTLGKLAARYKFTNKVKPLLKPILYKYNIVRLARKLIDMYNKNDMSQMYDVDLTEVEAPNNRTKHFREMFIEGINTNGKTKLFLQNLDEEITKLSKQTLTLSNVNASLSNISKTKNSNSWPIDPITDVDVSDFLEHLVFAVNQPNQHELGIQLKEELAKEHKSDYAEQIYYRLHYKMLWWLAGYGKEFISQENVHEYFYAPNITDVTFDLSDPITSFTGRLRELKTLHEMVYNKPKVTVISQRTAVTGLGGIGKTELARKYAYEYKEHYDNNIIWINAESESTLVESFHKLAVFLKIAVKNRDGVDKPITMIIEDVFKFFGTDKSLFIFDNADRKENESEENHYLDKLFSICLLPDINKPYVIITSRIQDWGGNTKTLKLDVFTEQEANSFVRNQLKIQNGNEQEITDLTDLLQKFPLALQQAVAYIKEKKEELNLIGQQYTIYEYIQNYKAKTKELLQYRNAKDSYVNQCTFITWEISLEAIKKEKHGDIAIDLLNIMAYLNPTEISVLMFLRLIKDELDLASAVYLLDRYSMVGVYEDPTKLNIHRLVQNVTRIKLKDNKTEEEILRKSSKLLLEFMRNIDLEIRKNYTVHAKSVWSFVSQHKKLVRDFAQLPYEILNTLRPLFKLEEACTFGAESLKVVENELDPIDVYTDGIKRVLSLIYADLGRNDEALKLCMERKELFSILSENNVTLAIKHQIASIYQDQGKLAEAYKLYKEVYDKSDPTDPQKLTTQHRMASILQTEGKLDEALKEYCDVYNKRRQLIGTGYSIEKEPNILRNTINTLHCIANVYTGKCNYLAAEAIYNKAYEEASKELGTNDIETWNIKHSIGLCFLFQSKFDEALLAFEELYTLSNETLGPDHPDTLGTLHCIGDLYRIQGKYEIALSTLEKVYEISKRVMGADHPDTLKTEQDLALVLQLQGKLDEALRIFHKIYKIRDKKMNHPDIFVVRQNLQETLNLQFTKVANLIKTGNLYDALKSSKEMFDVANDVFGPNNLNTKIAEKFIFSISIWVFYKAYIFFLK